MNNAERREYHASVAANRRLELQTLLDTALTAPDISADKAEELNTFCVNYSNRLYFEPFMKGLRQLISCQIEKDCFVGWKLLDDVFTQTEADYLKDAVKLLHSLQIRQYSQDGMHRTFIIESNDKILKRLDKIALTWIKKMKHKTKGSGEIIYLERRRETERVSCLNCL
jgi:hypothetical protein